MHIERGRDEFGIRVMHHMTQVPLPIVTFLCFSFDWSAMDNIELFMQPNINFLRVLPMDCIIQYLLQETKVWVLQQILTSALNFTKRVCHNHWKKNIDILYKTFRCHSALSEVHCLFCSHVFENKI